MLLGSVLRLDVALDLELLATDKYTGDYFFEEARGLAEAAGIDYKVEKSENILCFIFNVLKDNGCKQNCFLYNFYISRAF